MSVKPLWYRNRRDYIIKLAVDLATKSSATQSVEKTTDLAKANPDDLAEAKAFLDNLTQCSIAGFDLKSIQEVRNPDDSPPAWHSWKSKKLEPVAFTRGPVEPDPSVPPEPPAADVPIKPMWEPDPSYRP